MTANKGPTLTDAKGLGGIIAQDGFDYQVWDALIRLPIWLRNPAFEGFAVEVLEDAEARFFAPHAPHRHLIDRMQAKSGVLDRAGLVDVFKSFQTFDTAHPEVARIQTLVTPALPAKLNWLARDPERVRRARPFYCPFTDINAASSEKLRSDLVAEFGSDLGNFFARSVEVSLRPVSDRNMAEIAFSAELQQQFPQLDVSRRKFTAAFTALYDLTAKSRGSLLSRSLLLDTLCENLETNLMPIRHVLPVHVRSDRNSEAVDTLEIDASGFSGGSDGYPQPQRWRTGLQDPLAATANWARQQEFTRIALTGSYRLSTAFALGWAFRSTAGFEIDIQTKNGIWPTDIHPGPKDTALPWAITQPDSLIDGRLIVGIGILRDPMSSIFGTWPSSCPKTILLANLQQPITSALEAQVAVRTAKAAVAEAASRLRASRIEICFVGPAAFAVALGHRWNGLPPTQFNEFVPTNNCYCPTTFFS